MTKVGRRAIGVLATAAASLALWGGIALAGGSNAFEPSDGSTTAVVQQDPRFPRGLLVQTQEEDPSPGQDRPGHNCPRDRSDDDQASEEASV